MIVRRFSENAKANPTNAEADDQQQRLPAHYRDPSFYKYFPTFLAENSLRKHLPPELWFQYSRALEELEELQEIVQQTSNLGGGDSTEQQSDDDKAFSELAQAELETSTSRLAQLQEQMLTAVVTDDREVTECTLEVRAGVGGKEACLFADELHRLYLKFIAYSGWEVRGAGEGFNEDLESSEQAISNIDDSSSSSLWSASVEVVGAGCYRALRHEAGVHRVQRVPKTERYGRIHTSTVSLSVLPVRANLVAIREADLKFDVKNSSGAGGQNVNRNLTCVRVTHLPTGLAVEAQETRYQYLNKEIALRKLTALLNNLEFERQAKEARAERRLQIGLTAARSDKIRTYNWPQNRITDHRLTGGDGGGGGGNFHNISGYMAGEECERMKATIERLEEGRHIELVRQVRLALEQSFLKTTTAAAAKKRKK